MLWPWLWNATSINRRRCQVALSHTLKKDDSRGKVGKPPSALQDSMYPAAAASAARFAVSRPRRDVRAAAAGGSWPAWRPIFRALCSAVQVRELFKSEFLSSPCRCAHTKSPPPNAVPPGPSPAANSNTHPAAGPQTLAVRQQLIGGYCTFFLLN